MKVTLVITTINKPNKNIELFCKGSKKNNWNLEIVGDRKSPKLYKINYGNFYSIIEQKKLPFKFSNICPENSYSRKNIGYLISMKKGSNVIVETDDVNIPKSNFFKEKKLTHSVNEIRDTGWINIYNKFLKYKTNIWPRGLPLHKIYTNPNFKNVKVKKFFFLHQGVCEGNPDVDAIFRIINKKINIKFKNNFKFSLGKALSPLNSQNTVWFKKIFSLMYLPVTCSMRATDIWRGIIALNIILNDNLSVLFFGTTMKQIRNVHNLFDDLEQEMPLYNDVFNAFKILRSLNLKKGSKYYLKNLVKSYEALIKQKIFDKKELIYLNAWVRDIKNL